MVNSQMSASCVRVQPKMFHKHI